MVYLVVLGLLFVLGIVFAILGRSTWRWPDILAGILVLIAALSFVFLLSLSLKTRREWVKTVAKERSDNDRLKAQNRRLLWGEDNEGALSGDDNLTSISTKLSRVLLDRGRVWRDTVPSVGPNDTFNITIPGADAANPHQITPRFILYLFRENDVTVEGIPLNVPTNYIGEFEVVAVAENSVQVRPILYSPGLRAVLEAQGANFTQVFSDYYVKQGDKGFEWSLYETLPIDDHLIFSIPDSEPDLAAVGEPAFGKPEDKAVNEIVELVTNKDIYSPREITPEMKQAMKNMYLHDGERADPEKDAAQQIYTKVRLSKEYVDKVDTDVGAAGTGNLQFFDSQGRTVADFLRTEEEPGKTKGEITLPKDSVILVPQAQATIMIRDGVGAPVENVYLRPLNDYSTAIRSSYERLLDSRLKQRSTQRNLDLLTTANQALGRMLQQKQDERLKLEADVKKMTYEHQQMQGLEAQVDAQLAALKTNIRETLARCLSLEQQIENAQRYISENVERAVQEAEVQETVATP